MRRGGVREVGRKQKEVKGLVEFWEEKGEDRVRELRVYTRDYKLLYLTHIDLLWKY